MVRMADDAPPKTMTWTKALPALLIAGVFDALRYFFALFWITGPALIGGVVAQKASGVLGAKLALVLGGAAGAAAGYYGAPVFVTLGAVMSIVVVILGLLTLLVFLLISNPRIFKRDMFYLPWILFGIVASLLFTTWKLHRTQIRKERATLAAWRSRHAADERARQARRAALLARARAERTQAEAARAATEAEEEAPEEIPEEVREAA